MALVKLTLFLVCVQFRCLLAIPVLEKGTNRASNRSVRGDLCRSIDDLTLHQRAWELARLAHLPPPKLPQNLTDFVGKRRSVFLRNDPVAVCNTSMEMVIDPALEPPVLIVNRCQGGRVTEKFVLNGQVNTDNLPRGPRTLKCKQVNKTVLMMANLCSGELEWMESFMMEVQAGCHLVQPLL